MANSKKITAVKFAKKISITQRKRWLFCFVKYLWVLVLLPKVLQLVVCIYFLIRAFVTKKQEHLILPRTAIFLLLGSLVQIMAVLLQIAQGVTDLERIFAAFNTCCVWLIGIAIYILALNEEWHSSDLKKLGKYLLLNFAFLGFIFLLGSFTSIKKINILGMTYQIFGADYSEIVIGADSGTRFRGMMGSALAPSHMFLICLPLFTLAFSQNKKYRIFWIAIFIIAFFAVLASHSRAGMLLDSVCVLFCFCYLITHSKETQQIGKTLVGITIALFILIILVYYEDFIEILSDLIASRSGSNNARFEMYEATFSKVMNESPLIGVGIKYLINSIPYGSHCAYLGILYKSGIIGSLFFLIGFYGLTRRLYRGCSSLNEGGGILVYSEHVLFCIFVVRRS